MGISLFANGQFMLALAIAISLVSGCSQCSREPSPDLNAALPLISPVRPERWIAYYAASGTPEEFFDYDIIVFDADIHPNIAPLIDRGKMVLAYINFGQIEEFRKNFARVKLAGLLLKEDELWPGEWSINMLDRQWMQFLLDEIIPNALRQGFNGVLLDTIDRPIDLERRFPKKYRGMTEAALKNIRTIRLNYPDMKIMVNRGYGLLEQMAPYIDMVLAESLFTSYDLAKQSYQRLPEASYAAHLTELEKARKINTRLKIYTLEYWDSQDHAGIKDLYHQQRQIGFIPHVAGNSLDAIVAEPQ